jgi:uncharacterized membrane protein
MIAIAMMVAGIVMLIKGTVAFSANRELRRPGSVFVGLVLVLPFPLSFAIGFFIGLNAVKNGQNLEDIQKNAILIDLIIIGICAVLASILAIVLAEPKRKSKKKRRLGEYDDYDARADADDDDRFDELESPRRRRTRDDDDEEEDRPSRRRARRDDDDDDDSDSRPRRR